MQFFIFASRGWNHYISISSYPAHEINPERFFRYPSNKKLIMHLPFHHTVNAVFLISVYSWCSFHLLQPGLVHPYLLTSTYAFGVLNVFLAMDCFLRLFFNFHAIPPYYRGILAAIAIRKGSFCLLAVWKGNLPPLFQMVSTFFFYSGNNSPG